MTRGNRPSILRTGQVRDDGTVVAITGWGLGLCMTGCTCHEDPGTHQLRIDPNTSSGTLGLVSHRPRCTCCQPWTAAELAAVIRDLAHIEALPHAT